MSRRNSIRKRLEHHRATVAAESSRESRRATLHLRRTVKTEASKLAGELERVVQLQPANSTAHATAENGAVKVETSQSSRLESTVGKMQIDCPKSGRIRKNNTERRKAALRRRKIEMRMRERMSRDVDMFDDEDDIIPAPKLGPFASKAGGSSLTGGEERNLAVSREVREGNVAMSETRSLSLKKVKTIKKSMAKRRREERKLKLQILMRESIKAADHDDSS
jgi:hypothetical protein